MTTWRPTPALVRACLLALGGVAAGLVLGQEVLAGGMATAEVARVTRPKIKDVAVMNVAM